MASKVPTNLVIDRATKLAFIERNPTAGSMVVEALPVRIDTVLTDNGVAVAPCAATKWNWEVVLCVCLCHTHDSTREFIQPYHP